MCLSQTLTQLCICCLQRCSQKPSWMWEVGFTLHLGLRVLLVTQEYVKKEKVGFFPSWNFKWKCENCPGDKAFVKRTSHVTAAASLEQTDWRFISQSDSMWRTTEGDKAWTIQENKNIFNLFSLNEKRKQKELKAQTNTAKQNTAVTGEHFLWSIFDTLSFRWGALVQTIWANTGTHCDRRHLSEATTDTNTQYPGLSLSLYLASGPEFGLWPCRRNRKQICESEGEGPDLCCYMLTAPGHHLQNVSTFNLFLMMLSLFLMLLYGYEYEQNDFTT